jgi:hypothetical protein
MGALIVRAITETRNKSRDKAALSGGYLSAGLVLQAYPSLQFVVDN